MFFRGREQLCIIEVNEEDGSKITFEKLARVLIDNPTNMVYCVKAGKLYGIISMGDIHRAKVKNCSSVDINMSFTFLHEHEYMKARKLFFENDRINALPIVDEGHRLVGDYYRWDDDLYGDNFDFFKGNKYADIFFGRYSKVAIVWPNKQTPKKVKKVEDWKKRFELSHVEVEIIHRHDIIKAFEDNDMIFFQDEDEFRGLGTLYSDMLNKDFKWAQASTLDGITKGVLEIIIEDILKNIMDKGVYFITLQLEMNENAYWNKVNFEIDSKFKKIGAKKDCQMQEAFWKEFYEDKYDEEYILAIEAQDYPQVYKNGSFYLKDAVGKYYNATDGERLTVGQPDKYNNTIYFFGPCFIVGRRAEDAYTIESRLQEILNDNNSPNRVVNCGCWGSESQLLQRIYSTNFKQGDIAIIYERGRCFSDIPSINLAECLERENIPSCWFLDSLYHPNYKVYELWAKEIYDYIPKYLLDKKSNTEVVKKKEEEFPMLNAYIERYFAGYKRKGTVGAIIMNCNPFTHGHRFLIEEACKRVSQLIIFVVEENKSLFSFKERFAMVVEGIRDLKNVRVVPSGNYILSQETFPEYFLKLEDEDVSRNAEFDIKLFAELIAPKLNITFRFVGEEKTDAVTAEYNNAMKKILPKYGIELVEIPRKCKMDGNPICATDVRTLLDAGKFDDVRALVPGTTFEILLRSWN